MAYKKKMLILMVLAMSGGAYSGRAEPVLVTNIQKGTVACLSLKDAKAYASYVQKAPHFAADLIARANCFVVEKEEEAVNLGAEKGYQKRRLLSGHNIWVPEKH